MNTYFVKEVLLLLLQLLLLLTMDDLILHHQLCIANRKSKTFLTAHSGNNIASRQGQLDHDNEPQP